MVFILNVAHFSLPVLLSALPNTTIIEGWRCLTALWSTAIQNPMSFCFLPHNKVSLVDVPTTLTVPENSTIANHCTLLQGELQGVVLHRRQREALLARTQTYTQPLEPKHTGINYFHFITWDADQKKKPSKEL